jgi:hypothetical protein
VDLGAAVAGPCDRYGRDPPQFGLVRLTGGNRPVGSLDRRRTFFRFQWCRWLSTRITRRQAKLSSMPKVFLATACRTRRHAFTVSDTAARFADGSGCPVSW